MCVLCPCADARLCTKHADAMRAKRRATKIAKKGPKKLEAATDQMSSPDQSPDGSPPSASVPVVRKTCQGCGEYLKPGRDVLCESCGKKRSRVPDSSSVLTPLVPAAAQAAAAATAEDSDSSPDAALSPLSAYIARTQRVAQDSPICMACHQRYAMDGAKWCGVCSKSVSVAPSRPGGLAALPVRA
jgi:hypothetical protein